MKTIDRFTHKWTFDLPWHMVDLKDWFYMVNAGRIDQTVFLHVRVLGLRSLWTFSDPTLFGVDWGKLGSERTVVGMFENGKMVDESTIEALLYEPEPLCVCGHQRFSHARIVLGDNLFRYGGCDLIGCDCEQYCPAVNLHEAV